MQVKCKSFSIKNLVTILKNGFSIRQKSMPQIWFFKYIVKIDDFLIQNNESTYHLTGLSVNFSTSLITGSFKSFTFNISTLSGKVGESSIKIHFNDLFSLTKIQFIQPKIKAHVQNRCVTIFPCEIIAFAHEPSLIKIIFSCGSITLESKTFANYTSNLILSFPNDVNFDLIKNEIKFASVFCEDVEKTYSLSITNVKYTQKNVYFEQIILNNSFDTFQELFGYKDLPFQINVNNFEIICRINKFEKIHFISKSFCLKNCILTYESCDISFITDKELLSKFTLGKTKIFKTNLISDKIKFQLHQNRNTKHLIYVLKLINFFNSTNFSAELKKLNISILNNKINFTNSEVKATKINENILNLIENIPDLQYMDLVMSYSYSLKCELIKTEFYELNEIYFNGKIQFLSTFNSFQTCGMVFGNIVFGLFKDQNHFFDWNFWQTYFEFENMKVFDDKNKYEVFHFKGNSKEFSFDFIEVEEISSTTSSDLINNLLQIDSDHIIANNIKGKQGKYKKGNVFVQNLYINNSEFQSATVSLKSFVPTFIESKSYVNEKILANNIIWDICNRSLTVEYALFLDHSLPITTPKDKYQIINIKQLNIYNFIINDLKLKINNKNKTINFKSSNSKYETEYLKIDINDISIDYNGENITIKCNKTIINLDPLYQFYSISSYLPTIKTILFNSETFSVILTSTNNTQYSYQFNTNDFDIYYQCEHEKIIDINCISLAMYYITNISKTKIISLSKNSSNCISVNFAYIDNVITSLEIGCNDVSVQTNEEIMRSFVDIVSPFKLSNNLGSDSLLFKQWELKKLLFPQFRINLKYEFFDPNQNNNYEIDIPEFYCENVPQTTISSIVEAIAQSILEKIKMTLNQENNSTADEESENIPKGQFKMKFLMKHKS